jgi:hypothetical protein
MNKRLVQKLTKLTKTQLINCIIMDSASGKWDLIIKMVKEDKVKKS